jgi:hypothetical protein
VVVEEDLGAAKELGFNVELPLSSPRSDKAAVEAAA